jgi:type I restriction enzyme S subunit
MTFPSASLSDCVVYLQRGKSPIYADAGNVRILNQRCIRWKGFELEHAKVLDDSEAVALDKARFLRPGDVVVNSTGEGTIGRANVWQESAGRWVADSHVTIIRPNGNLLSEWLKFWLESPMGQRFVLDSKTGATKQTELSSSKLRDCSIPLPDLIQQQAIIGRIEECVARVDEVEHLSSGVARDAEHLPIAFRYDLWDGCSRKYQCVSLQSMVSSTKNGLYKPRNHHGSGAVLLRMFNINGALLDLTRIDRMRVTQKEGHDFLVSNGDILISRVNSRELVGKSALVNGLSEPAVHEAMLIRLRTRSELVNEQFLVSLMNSPQFLHELRRKAKHAIGQSSINQQDLLESKLPMPPLQEQLKYVERFEEFGITSGALTRETVDQGHATRVLRETVLRKAFAGEL